jgi:hypothetical protein
MRVYDPIEEKGINKASAPRTIWAYKVHLENPNIGLSGMPGLEGMAKDIERLRALNISYQVICYTQHTKKCNLTTDRGKIVNDVVEYVRADVIQELQADLELAQEENEKLKQELEDVWRIK